MANLVRLPARLAGIVLVTTVWISTGCDSTSFVPPPPPELRSGGTAVNPTPSRSSPVSAVTTTPTMGRAIELVLSRHGADDSDALKAAARTQAGNDNARIKIAVLSEQEQSARQAELIREATARHPLALIVEPADPGDPALAGAVNEARNTGVPVILIGHPLASLKPGHDSAATTSAPDPGAPKSTSSVSTRPVTLVVPAPFAPTAEVLVASAIRNAKNANLPTQGGAIILFDTKCDPWVHERVNAIRDALKSAGITTIHDLPFERESQIAVKKLTESLHDNPKIDLVFSLDYQSFNANKEVCDAVAEQRPFISASFTTDDHFTSMAMFGEFAAVAQLGGTRLVRKAISTAMTAVQGRVLPARIEVPITFFDSPPIAGLPRIQDTGGPKKKLGG